jgi:hypothetical protein
MRPSALGLALVVVEALLSLAGVRWGVLSALALVLAPGLALVALLPRELGSFGRWLAVPVVGIAAASVVIIPVAATGVALTGLSLRLMLLAMALAGVAMARWVGPEPSDGTAASAPSPFWRDRTQLGVALCLLGILCLGAALQGRIIAGTPVPGEDWASHLLYADQIARQHGLLIDNPFWMLGGHGFSSDPGVASIYGSFLIMSGVGTTVLVHGIWVFALLSIVSVFLLTRSLWGSGAGLVAAALYAVLPINHNMLGWHGLANMYALCFIPLALLAAGWALRGRGTVRWSWVLALTLVALAAGHRLSFLVTGFAVALIAVGGLVFSADRRQLIRFGLRTAAFLVPLGGLVGIDLAARGADSGGFQSYKVYLVTKLVDDLAIRDVTYPVAIAGALALVALATRSRRDPAYLVLVGLGLATVVLTYGYVLHVPTVYYRIVYYLPVALTPAIGVALAWFAHGRLRRLRRQVSPAAVAGLAGLALVGVTAQAAYHRGAVVRDYYGWTSAATAKGLDEVTRRAGPDDVVVADRCSGFLSEWLLQRPVLAGFDPADILPSWEAQPAAQARTILYGPAAKARRMARSKNARFLLLNPACTSDETEKVRLPQIGEPIYQSSKLVVLDVDARPPTGGGRDRRRPQRQQALAGPQRQGGAQGSDPAGD